MTLFLTVATIVGLCNASPHLIRRDQLPGARVIEIAARETGSPVLNSTIPLNATSSESVTASVTDTAPAATDPPTSTICITMMMQVDYLQCGKRKGYRYDVNSCDGKTFTKLSLTPCSTASEFSS